MSAHIRECLCKFMFSFFQVLPPPPPPTHTVTFVIYNFENLECDREVYFQLTKSWTLCSPTPYLLLANRTIYFLALLLFLLFFFCAFIIGSLRKPNNILSLPSRIFLATSTKFIRHIF